MLRPRATRWAPLAAAALAACGAPPVLHAGSPVTIQLGVVGAQGPVVDLEVTVGTREGSAGAPGVTGWVTVAFDPPSSPTSLTLLGWRVAAPPSIEVPVLLPIGRLPVQITGLVARHARPAEAALLQPGTGEFQILTVPALVEGRAFYETAQESSACVRLTTDGAPCTLDTAFNAPRTAALMSAALTVRDGVATIAGTLRFTAPLDPARPSIASVAAQFAIRGSTPIGARCAGDFDGSGATTVADIFAYLSAWFGSAPGADFDGNAAVNVSDIFLFLSAWFAGC